MDNMKIGQFICELRKEKQMTQKELADKLHITDKAVSKWERGKSLPDLEMMSQLCRTFGISINELLSGERIPTEELEFRAEKNIKELILENESSRKNNRCNIIMGLSVLILSFFMLVISLLGTDFTKVIWYVDFPSIIVFACVLTALRLISKSGLTSENKIIEQCTFPIGVMMSIMNIITMLNSTTDIYMKNIAICILPLLYSSITYIVWQCLKHCKIA